MVSFVAHPNSQGYGFQEASQDLPRFRLGSTMINSVHALERRVGCVTSCLAQSEISVKDSVTICCGKDTLQIQERVERAARLIRFNMGDNVLCRGLYNIYARICLILPSSIL